jgi:adenine-specific DNA-methyltransferase
MIRSELDVLLDKVQDSALRADLRSQIDRINERRSFGLVFERHIPERVRLPQHPIRVGSHVVSRDDANSPTFEVLTIDEGYATIVQVRDAGGAYVRRGEHGVRERAAVDSLVVISDFGEPVLPGLRQLGSVQRGGGKPYHVVIKGENYHALEALRFTHAGKVDCIYIDPPYNSGARDWKYNNDYVDESDEYRHSKWLAFMERRLQLAKELLNPDDSVLIVTIDEKEHLRLGLLLEQIFQGAYIEMVTSVISAKGAYRRGHFSRVEEHLFFVCIGAARIRPWTSNMLPSYADEESSDRDAEDAGPEASPLDDADADADSVDPMPIEWLGLRRREPSSVRGARPNQFYPIFVNRLDGSLHSIGEAIDDSVDRNSITAPAGTVPLWPLKPDGTEMLWGLSPDALRLNWASGWARVNGWNKTKRTGTVQYLPSGTIAQIRSGRITLTGRGADGSVEGYATANVSQWVTPKRVWHLPSHNAETGGTNVLSALAPGRRFPYPKSLYAVEDAIRFAVGDKPAAVVLDYFAGSGTTAHAVARLNKQDGGRRISIMVTDNEVSAVEATQLRSLGWRPGDPEWEALGIFEHVTRPRVTSTITGRTPDGEPIRGNYRFTDQFPMADGFEENAVFFELRYLDADDVDLGMAFEDLAPMLWLRAGAEGPIAGRANGAGAPVPYVWTDRYGVLFDEDRWRRFVSDRPNTARAAFIVTYSPTLFAGVSAELPTDMEVIRLPDSYLSMFLPDRGRA